MDEKTGEGKPKLGSGERFKSLATDLAKKGAKDPAALAAWIGRKKYGKEKFQQLAAKGRASKECIEDAINKVLEGSDPREVINNL